MAKTTTTVAKKKTGKAALGVSSKGVCKASKDKKTAASTRSDKKATANGTEKKKRKTPEAEPTKAKKAKAGKAKAEKAANGNATETPDEAEAAVVPAGALENFNISEPVKKALTKKGINSLFPIQISTYKIILEEGADVIGRARTGQGKTLAFVLPVIESLCRKYGERTSRPAYGRAPGVLVLTPTRELAKQVASDFDYYGQSLSLTTLTVYGGAPMGPQESTLRRGVDIVVGTPGRVKDFLERGALNLKELEFRILDEADEMLNMGFVEDVETILGAVSDASKVQTLLFSATLPQWAKDLSRRFFRSHQKMVDLVGDERMKASSTVRHIAMKVHWTQKMTVVADIVRVYGKCEGEGAKGRTIVFTETKNDANELANALTALGARPLHGDVPQAQREVVLKGFRDAKFRVLVATDVAARGLDISGVDLVVQLEPPKEPETYIHRSGRTGRANTSGVSVTLYGMKKEYLLGVIERKAGFKFEKCGTPQPHEIAMAAAETASNEVKAVSKDVAELFKDAAKTLVQESERDPIDLLAAALARISGHSNMKPRSLITSHEDTTTLLFEATGTTIRTPTYVWNYLRNHLSEELVGDVKRVVVATCGTKAVLDVSPDNVDAFAKATAGNITISRCKTLPELPIRDQYNGGYGGGRGGYGGRGGGDRNGYGGYGGRGNGDRSPRGRGRGGGFGGGRAYSNGGGRGYSNGY